MAKKVPWFSPFIRQCLVTLGVTLNISEHGLIVAFPAGLLPQLRAPGSTIPIDDSSGSWIASIVGFALIVGNFIVPTIMAKFGRKPAHIISIVPLIIGWFGVCLATNITVLLVSRFLQGVSLGISASLGPVLIGEYTSPQYRGALLTTLSLGVAMGVLVIHVLGAYLTWQTTALICSFIGFTDLLIVLYSPESPSWLAEQGRYDEARKVFRWLRGDGEEKELKEMVDASIIMHEMKVNAELNQRFSKKVVQGVSYFKETLKKKEFYKPIFIMVHIYALGQWAGANVLAAYTTDVYRRIMGNSVDVALMSISVDTQRIISNTCAVFIMRRVKRRTMLFITVGINIVTFLLTAGYCYGKENDILPFDHPAIGAALIHTHMFSIATGTVPLPYIIAGEVFPLQYRSLAGGISVLFVSINLFATIKTVPLLFNSIGLYGAYCLYAVIVSYCLYIAWMFLPETKDRTLNEIEDEFRGRSLTKEEMKAAESLLSLRFVTMDRRCRNPVY